MDDRIRSLYDQLTDDERLQLDTLVLSRRERLADGAAFVERDQDDAVRAARDVLRRLRRPDRLRDEEIELLLQFYMPLEFYEPGATTVEPTIENLRIALDTVDTEIDPRVRDGLQVSDADARTIGTMARQNFYREFEEREAQAAAELGTTR